MTVFYFKAIPSICIAILMLLSIENFVLISKYQIYVEKQIEIQALITEIGVFTITTLFMGFAEPIKIKET